MVYCPECGRKNPNDARVCGYCGADIRDAAARERDKVEAEKRAEERAQKKRETRYRIVKAILVVVVIVGGIIAVATIPEFLESVEKSMGTCRYDYETTYTTRIGQYSTAEPGYEFAVVILRIENNASQSISTNAHNWEMVVDNVTYDHSFETYDDNIDHMTADIEKGGEITTHIVFEIPQQRSSGPTLKYTGWFPPKLVRDKTLLP